MSIQRDPKHNLDALLVGTGEFSFSEGAKSKTDAFTIGWLDFGNIVAFTPQVEHTEEKHIGSYRGIRRRDRTLVTEANIRYSIKLDEWNLNNLRMLFGGASGVGPGQTAQTAVSADSFAFNTGAPSGTRRWFDIKVGGSRIRKLTALTISGMVEGTDFEVDNLLGRVRFIVSQPPSTTPVVIVPVVTAPVISFSDPDYFIVLSPLADLVKSGYGRMIIYDQNDANKIVLDHRDFSCEVSVDSSSEVNGTSPTEIILAVDVTTDLGVIYTRLANDNYYS